MMVFDFRSAQKIHCLKFFLQGFQQYAKTPHLTNFRVDKNAKISSVANCSSNNNNKKMCGRMVTSCGMARTSHCAVHLPARARHMNNTDAHTTTHSHHGIVGVRGSTCINRYTCHHVLYLLHCKWSYASSRSLTMIPGLFLVFVRRPAVPYVWGCYIQAGS